MSGEKKQGTKWISFLYGFIIFQCVMLVVSLLLVLGEAQRYSYYYGSYGWQKIEGSVYLSVLVIVISFIVKVCACKKKYTESGYSLLIFSLIIDVLCVLILGVVKAGIPGFMTILLIPNLIYLKKRKALFVGNHDDLQTGDTTPKCNYKCGKCGKIGPYIGDCPACGCSLKIWFDVEAPKEEQPKTIAEPIVESDEPKKIADTLHSNAERSIPDVSTQLNTETSPDHKTPNTPHRAKNTYTPVHTWLCPSCKNKISSSTCPYCGN